MNLFNVVAVQNVEACERMLGLEVGPARPSLFFVLVECFRFRFACACGRIPHAAALLRAAQAELAAAEIASAPRVLVTTAGQISRTLKTRARAFPLF